ncbi:MAG: heavy-metal-associated domain-containing protein [Chloroflexi bacterium]|mgnify:FL=1|nr:heavy-metal-associated domain-containing protein [Chloroflexota bacterium]
MATTVLHAQNISCPHCAMTIKRELGPIEGILSVSVDVPTQAVSLEYTGADALERAKATLDDLGYPVRD